MENPVPEAPSPGPGNKITLPALPLEIIGMVILSFALGGLVLIPRIIYQNGLAPAPLAKAEEILSTIFDSTKSIHHLSKANFSFKPAPAGTPKPMQPLTTAAAAQPVLNLEGIIYDPDGNSQVLINGQIFGTEAVLPGGYKITAIEEERVLLIWGVQKYTLSNKTGLQKARPRGAANANA